jgi:hypothetical protein
MPYDELKLFAEVRSVNTGKQASFFYGFCSQKPQEFDDPNLLEPYEE